MTKKCIPPKSDRYRHAYHYVNEHGSDTNEVWLWPGNLNVWFDVYHNERTPRMATKDGYSYIGPVPTAAEVTLWKTHFDTTTAPG